MEKNMVKSKKDLDLNLALSYDGESVVYRFMDSYDVSFEEGKILFEETKKWLWLCAKVREMKENDLLAKGFNLNVDISLSMIDEMWHTFILFTNEYTQYCLNSFGYYVHHSPLSKKEKEKAAQRREKNVEEAKRRSVARTEKQYQLTYDLLGKETLLLWYDTFAQKYTPEKIKILRK